MLLIAGLAVLHRGLLKLLDQEAVLSSSSILIQPIAALNIQRKIDGVDITISMSVSGISLNTPWQHGAELKYCWIRNNNFNFSLSLSAILDRSDQYSEILEQSERYSTILEQSDRDLAILEQSDRYLTIWE